MISLLCSAIYFQFFFLIVSALILVKSVNMFRKSNKYGDILEPTHSRDVETRAAALSTYPRTRSPRDDN